MEKPAADDTNGNGSNDQPEQKWRKMRWFGKLVVLGIAFGVGYLIGENTANRRSSPRPQA